MLTHLSAEPLRYEKMMVGCLMDAVAGNGCAVAIQEATRIGDTRQECQRGRVSIASLQVQRLLGQLECAIKRLVPANESSRVDKDTSRHARHLVELFIPHTPPLLR